MTGNAPTASEESGEGPSSAKSFQPAHEGLIRALPEAFVIPNEIRIDLLNPDSSTKEAHVLVATFDPEKYTYLHETSFGPQAAAKVFDISSSEFASVNRLLISIFEERERTSSWLREQSVVRWASRSWLDPRQAGPLKRFAASTSELAENSPLTHADAERVLALLAPMRRNGREVSNPFSEVFVFDPESTFWGNHLQANLLGEEVLGRFSLLYNSLDISIVASRSEGVFLLTKGVGGFVYKTKISNQEYLSMVDQLAPLFSFQKNGFRAPGARGINRLMLSWGLHGRTATVRRYDAAPPELLLDALALIGQGENWEGFLDEAAALSSHSFDDLWANPSRAESLSRSISPAEKNRIKVAFEKLSTPDFMFDLEAESIYCFFDDGGSFLFACCILAEHCVMLMRAPSPRDVLPEHYLRPGSASGARIAFFQGEEFCDFLSEFGAVLP